MREFSCSGCSELVVKYYSGQVDFYILISVHCYNSWSRLDCNKFALFWLARSS